MAGCLNPSQSEVASSIMEKREANPSSQLTRARDSPLGRWFLKAEGASQPSELMFVIQSCILLGQDQLCLEMPAPCHKEIILMANDCQVFRSRTSPIPMPLLHEERQAFPTPVLKTSGFFLLFFMRFCWFGNAMSNCFADLPEKLTLP